MSSTALREVVLEPGDILLTKQSFARYIAFVMNFLQNDKVTYGHVAMVTNSGVVEALSTVKIGPIDAFIRKHKEFKVVRYRLMPRRMQKEVCKIALSYVGSSYSWRRLFLQALDQILFTNKFSGSLKSTRRQICSTLISFAYYLSTYPHLKFNDLHWNQVEPDDIDDESQRDKYTWESFLVKDGKILTTQP